MPDKVLVVEYRCDRCYKKMRRVLCKIQDKMKIKTISFDKEEHAVTISVPSDDADKVRTELSREAGRFIRKINIRASEKTKTAGKEGENETLVVTPCDLDRLVAKVLPANKSGPDEAPSCKPNAPPSSKPAQGVASIWPATGESVSGYGYQLAAPYYGVPVYNVYSQSQGWYGGGGPQPYYQQPPPPCCEEDPNAGCSVM